MELFFPPFLFTQLDNSLFNMARLWELHPTSDTELLPQGITGRVRRFLLLKAEGGDRCPRRGTAWRFAEKEAMSPFQVGPARPFGAVCSFLHLCPSSTATGEKEGSSIVERRTGEKARRRRSLGVPQDHWDAEPEPVKLEQREEVATFWREE